MSRYWTVRVAVVVSGLAFFGYSGIAVAGRGVDANRPVARADVKAQLSWVSLPPSARRVGRDQSASTSLGRPDYPKGLSYELFPGYVVAGHRFWRVARDPARVASWVKVHPPTAFRAERITGGSGGRPFRIVFRFPVDPGRVAARALVVLVTAARGGGSEVRADSVAMWLPARPAWDQVPPDVRVLRATLTFLHKAPRSITITSRAEVQLIAGRVNGETALWPGPRCPRPPTYIQGLRLVFRARPGGPVVARAAGSPFGCPYLVLTVHGRRGPRIGMPGMYRLFRQIHEHYLAQR